MLTPLFLNVYYAAASWFGNYAPNPYVGLWEYRTDSTVFRLQVREDRNFMPPNPTAKPSHVLMGGYSFSRRGQVVEETFSKPAAVPFIALLLPGYERSVAFNFQDAEGRLMMDVLLKPKPGKAKVLIWKCQKRKVLPVPPIHAPRLTLPASFELVRLK